MATRGDHSRAEGRDRRGRARAGGVTDEQNRLEMRLKELANASDWLGVVALEREALALAREVRGSNPGVTISNALGLGFQGTALVVSDRYSLSPQATAVMPGSDVPAQITMGGRGGTPMAKTFMSGFQMTHPNGGITNPIHALKY